MLGSIFGGKKTAVLNPLEVAVRAVARYTKVVPGDYLAHQVEAWDKTTQNNTEQQSLDAQIQAERRQRAIAKFLGE